MFDFVETLSRSARFVKSKTYVLTEDTFEKDFALFHADLLTYARLFHSVFKFLAEDNEKCIPIVDNKKPHGLIYLFIENVPFKEFMYNIMSELRTVRATSIRAFIEDIFLPKIDELLALTKPHHQVAPYFRSRTFDHRDSSAETSAKTSASATKMSKGPNRFFKPRPSTSTLHEKSQSVEAPVARANPDHSDVNYQPVQDVSVDSASDDEDIPMKSMPTEDIDMAEVCRQALNAIPSVLSRDTSGRPSSGRLYDTSTRSLGDSKPQGVCYTKLTRGDCTKPDCAFSHSSDAILRELTKLMTSWKGGTFTQSVPQHVPTRPPPAQPPPWCINPKLWDVAKKEFDRLLTYFYVKSDSSRASPLVIAPKATDPFIRFAGDYSICVNHYRLTGHWPIPNVCHSLEKIARFCMFSDIDLMNGFHQIPICEKTSEPTHLVDDVLVSENPSLLVSRKTAELSTEDPQAKTSNPSTLQTSLL
jgi:hypothetical protein